jgi:predicted amidohydrolase
MSGERSTGEPMLRLACWQGHRDHCYDRAHLSNALAAAAVAGAELLVAPAARPPPATGASEGLGHASDEPTLREVAALCRNAGIGLVLGYAERCSGRLHSAALMLDGEGHALANYRACHLGEAEAAIFSRGQWFSILPWNGWRIGLLIGSDLRLPEPARCLALAGADLLLVLGPSGSAGSAGHAIARTRAIENGLFVALSGEPGEAPPIFDPQGAVLGTTVAGESGLAIAELPRQPVHLAQRAALLAGRRPRLYRQLASIDEC